MKKFTVTALLIGVALMLAAPALAADVSWDGYLRVRGFLEQKATYNNAEDSYNAYYDMKWRTNWTMNVSDYLTLRSRWEALNQDGGTPAAGGGGQSNFDVQRAWMTIRSPYGVFEAGRMITQVFGTSYLDNETDVFRLNYVTKIADKVTLVVTAQKVNEGDGGDLNPPPAPDRWTTSDNDIDVYGFALVYPTENWSIGSLQVLLRNSQPGNGNIMRYSANPYFTGKFGNLALQAEGQFFLGDAGQNAAGNDLNYKAFGLNVEATYDIGMAALQLGFAYNSGDNDATDNDVENLPLGGDWEKFYLLFGTTGNAVEDLGGIGNFAQGGNTAGFTTVYGGASTNVTEKLNVGLSAAWAQANEPQSNAAGNEFDDSAGIEVDLRVNWNIYDNLVYNFTAAMLFSGDYWEDAAKAQANGATAGSDTPWALFHAIQLNF